MFKGTSFTVLVALSASLLACAQSSDPKGDDAKGTPNSIIGGSIASSYPEAVLVDMYQNGQLAAYCSGSLIAPSVVLTAGHCVFQFNQWKITAPFANGQKASASSGTTYDWTNTSESVDPSMHDIGLIFLDTPITLSSYPTLATAGLPSGSQIVNIGRIDSGKLSTTALYVSPSITVTSGQSSGFNFDYSATDEIQSGDSGGPDEQPGTHNIVAVNSGAGTGSEVLARVDLVSDWIQQQIQAHGGGGGGGQSGSGATTSASSGSGGGTCDAQQCMIQCMSNLQCGQCQSNGCACVDASQCQGQSSTGSGSSQSGGFGGSGGSGGSSTQGFGGSGGSSSGGFGGSGGSGGGFSGCGSSSGGFSGSGGSSGGFGGSGGSGGSSSSSSFAPRAPKGHGKSVK